MRAGQHSFLAALVVLTASCVFEWDDFDPRNAEPSGGQAGTPSTGGSGGTGSVGGGGTGQGGKLPGPQLIPALAGDSDDDDPTFDDEALDLYFSSTRSGDEDVWVSTRAAIGDAWGDPVQVPELNSPSQDTNGVIAPDGLTFWISSRRDGQLANDIYVSTRIAKLTAWAPPIPVAELNDVVGDDAVNSVSADNLSMIMERDGDLFAATRQTVSDPWLALAPIIELNGVTYDGGGWQAPDRLTLFFSSTRTGNREILMSTRTTIDDLWATPLPLSEVNTPADEADPWFSPDTSYMVLARDVSPDGGTAQRQLFEWYR